MADLEQREKKRRDRAGAAAQVSSSVIRGQFLKKSRRELPTTRRLGVCRHENFCRRQLCFKKLAYRREVGS
jgi:hypothetical protein